MPQTPPGSTSAEDEPKVEQPEQLDSAPKETPVESKENDAAAKARERMERFKALKARAVSLVICPGPKGFKLVRPSPRSLY
jgi:pre-mRNA-splicing factor SYF2